ncbi:MAG: hypothetical protein AAF741_07460 [Bacteroidota bacterium]
MSKLFPSPDAKSLSEYIIQVFLIIFSILAATWVGQCTERERNEEKLAVYIASIREEVDFEIQRHDLNLTDAQNDFDEIIEAIRLAAHPSLDSIYKLANYFIKVNIRGVFRTYPSSTWDAMVAAGESELIKDLDLRQQIATSFAFRNTTIREDLREWDAANQEAYEQVASFIDLPNLGNFDANFEKLLVDPEGFRLRAGPILKSLLRQCSFRLFHLDVAKGQFELIKEMMDDMEMDTNAEL